MKLLLAGATDADYTTRQAAVYGIGVAAQHTPTATFAAVRNAALSILFQIMDAKHARVDDDEIATDNAVSALGKIMDHHNLPELAQRWLR